MIVAVRLHEDEGPDPLPDEIHDMPAVPRVGDLVHGVFGYDTVAVARVEWEQARRPTGHRKTWGALLVVRPRAARP